MSEYFRYDRFTCWRGIYEMIYIKLTKRNDYEIMRVIFTKETLNKLEKEVIKNDISRNQSANLDIC